jgi:hypothetical protein
MTTMVYTGSGHQSVPLLAGPPLLIVHTSAGPLVPSYNWHVQRWDPPPPSLSFPPSWNAAALPELCHLAVAPDTR